MCFHDINEIVNNEKCYNAEFVGIQWKPADGKKARFDPLCLMDGAEEQLCPSQHFLIFPQLLFLKCRFNKHRLALLLSLFAAAKTVLIIIGSGQHLGLTCIFLPVVVFLHPYLSLGRIIFGCFRHLLLKLKSLLVARRALLKSCMLLVSSCL